MRHASGNGVGSRVGLVKCQAITLADGRKLLYYDERDGADRSSMDERELPPPPPASEVRYDPVLDEWVAIATHRQGRTFLPPTDECPLCPSRPGHLSEIPATDYDVVVFEKRFPSLSERFAGELTWHNGDLVPVRHGAGRCEVVCFTADHSSWFGALSEERVRTVFDVWADRTGHAEQRCRQLARRIVELNARHILSMASRTSPPVHQAGAVLDPHALHTSYRRRASAVTSDDGASGALTHCPLDSCLPPVRSTGGSAVGVTIV